LASDALINILNARINLLENIEARNIRAEALLILQYIQSHNILRDAYESIREGEEITPEIPLIHEFNQLEHELIQYICQTIVAMRGIISDLRNTDQIDETLMDIKLVIYRDLERYALDPQITQDLTEILGPPLTGAEATFDYRRVVWEIKEILKMRIQMACENENACIYLQNLHNFYFQIKGGINLDALSEDQLIVFEEFDRNITGSLLYLYEFFRCDWTLGQLDLQTERIGATVEWLLCQMAELFTFTFTAGMIEVKYRDYIERKPAIDAIEEADVRSSIGRLDYKTHFMNIPDVRIVFSTSRLREEEQEKQEIITDLKKISLAIQEKLLLEPFVENMSQSINTNYEDSTDFLRQVMRANLGYIRNLPPNILSNYCTVLSHLVNRMHLDADDPTFLQASANDFWAAHQNDPRIEMEVMWFQPKVRDILVREFGESVVKEVQSTRGKTDFSIYGIPIECKVITDRTVCTPSDSGIAVLETHESQAFQQAMHVRCGILIGYDYRMNNIIPEHRIGAISERIKIKMLGDKIIAIICFLGNMIRPSSH